MLLWPVDVHLYPFSKNTLILCVVLPKFCISISIIVVFNFFWDLQLPQEKLKTMLVQNFGGSTKSIEVFFEKRPIWFFNRYIFFLFCRVMNALTDMNQLH